MSKISVPKKKFDVYECKDECKKRFLVPSSENTRLEKPIVPCPYRGVIYPVMCSNCKIQSYNLKLAKFVGTVELD